MTYLALYDGTTIYNILDGGDYSLVINGWNPKPAPVRPDLLGGTGQHGEVSETLGLWVKGATPTALVDNLLNLVDLIDQANRWSAGDGVSPLVLYASSKTDTAAYQCVITKGDTRAIMQAAGKRGYFIEVGDHFSTPDDQKIRVDIPITRRALWVENTTLDWEESDEGLSTLNAKNVMFHDLNSASDTQALHPVDIELQTVQAAGATVTSTTNGYLAITNYDEVNNSIEILDPVSGFSTSNTNHWTTLTSVVSSRSGSVFQCKNNTVPDFIAQLDRPSDLDARYHVFVCWRNPSTVDFTGRVYASTFPPEPGSANMLGTGELFRWVCPSGTDDPVVTYCGTHRLGIDTTTKPGIGFAPETTGVANGLEIESVCYVRDDTGTNLFKIDDIGQREEADDPPLSDGDQSIFIYHNYMDELFPSLKVTQDSITWAGVDPVVVGDLFVAIRGGPTQSVLYATGYSGSWSPGNGANCEVELILRRQTGSRFP